MLKMKDLSCFLYLFKMPTMACILTFMNTINFMLSWVEHKKGFIIPGTGHMFFLGLFAICAWINSDSIKFSFELNILMIISELVFFMNEIEIYAQMSLSNLGADPGILERGVHMPV